MAKINRFATNEIEGLATSTTEIHPVGMHFDSDGTMFFSNGAAASKKFVAPGKIFGSGADSGDGQGRDTIKLIPDIDMFESASEQYVIIDSANPGAVHIRPGGTLNQSTAQLYIGGTKNYIKIDESTNSVSIGTKGTDVDTEWTFSSTGSMAYTTGLTFASPFPISFQANLNANSFISTGTSASFDGGTGFVYNVNFTIDSLGTVSGTVDEPVFTSNVGYKVGDTFSFGAAVHGIRDYSCEISITDITQITTGPDTFSANVSIDALPALEHIISSAKPIKLTAGTSNFILGTDGTIKLNSGSLLSETTVNLRNAFKIKPSSDSITELVVYSTTSSGNTAVVTTANLAEQSLTIGDVNQGLKLKTDGNLEIAATSRETGSVLNWKFNSDGSISNQDGSFYVKQSTFDDERSGIFTTSTANLTVGSEQYIFLKSGTSTWSLNNSSEFAFPNESVIAGSQWLSTYPALKLIPDGNNSPTIGLTVYTSTGSGNLVYLTPNDTAQSGMVFGTPTQQLRMAQDGGVTLLARNGVTADSVNVISATAGSNVYVTAGAAGDNQGDAGLGEEGGHLFLESGFSTKTGVPGGSINLKTGSGYGGFGNVNISVGAHNWKFDTDGILTLPSNIVFADNTIQSTAVPDRITSNTAQLIINGLGAQPYVLFPASPTGEQLQISQAEISSVSGNLALTSAEDALIIANGSGAVPGGSRLWKADRTGNLVLPQTDMMASPAPTSLPGITFTDGTFQTTAYTGSAEKVDITNTNGLTTTYYPTFVESRTNGQYMRADVDLTYRTDDNLLRSGNIQVGRNIYGSHLGGISNAIQLRPNIDIDKRFLFTVDSSGGNYIRSGMEMPVAEVDKAVTLGFPHTNGTVSYIYNQGTDTNGTEWNDALVIFQNGGNVKIGTITSGNGTKIWEFNQTGKIRFPDTTQQSTAWTGNINTTNGYINFTASPAPGTSGITFADGTTQTTAYTATSEQKFDIKATSFGVVGNKRYGVNTASGAVIATLPASPSLGDAVFFADAGGAFSTNSLTIDRNGNTIMGSAADIVINTNGDSLGLFWNGTTWRLYE